jgi:hypothetical protein
MELRGPDMFGLGAIDGAHRGKTSLDEATYTALLEELAQSFGRRTRRYPALVPPELYVDAPDGRKLCLTKGDLPPSSTLQGWVPPDEVLPSWKTAVFSGLGDAMHAAVEQRERWSRWKKRPVQIPEVRNLRHWKAGEQAGRALVAPPAGDGYYLTNDLLEGRSALSGQPGVVLDIYLRSARRALPAGQLAEIWRQADDQFRIAILTHLLKCGDEKSRMTAGRLLAERIVAARGNPNTSPPYLSDLCWSLLFGLECAAARGDRWPRDAAVFLLERDSDTDDQARILFQWLPTLLLNYANTDRARLGPLLARRMKCRMGYNPMLAAEPLAELAPADAARSLRQALAAAGPDDRILKWQIDAALVRLGDREAVRRFLDEMASAGDKVDDFYVRMPFLVALRFLPSEKDLKAGLKDVPLGNRKALADYLVDRAEAGTFLKATPDSRLASPRFAKWLLARLDEGGEPRAYFLDQLAWQTEPEAVERLITLLKQGDRQAMEAVSNRWSPRFFAAAELHSHAEYRLTPEAIRGVHWEEVRLAARAGSLHYYSVQNFPHEYRSIKGYLGEEF